MNEKEAIIALKNVKEMLDSHDIEFWLDTGTLLGAVRNDRFIPWDDDIDLRIWKKDLKRVVQILEKQKMKYYLVQDVFDPPRPTVKIYYSDFIIDLSAYELSDHLAIFSYRKPKKFIKNSFIIWNLKNLICLVQSKSNAHIIRTNIPFFMVNLFSELISSFPFKIRKNILTFLTKIITMMHTKVSLSIPVKYFKKLSKIEFYGMEFKIPSPVEEYLEYRYGVDWMTPERDYVFYEDDQAIVEEMNMNLVSDYE